MKKMVYLGLFFYSSWAWSQVAKREPVPNVIFLGVGESKVYSVPYAIERLAVAKDIIEVTTLAPKDILITGKALGDTQILLWPRDGRPAEVLMVAVHVPVAAIALTLQKAFPNSQISISASGSAVYLSGTAESIEVVDAAQKIASNHFRGSMENAPNIINLIEVPAIQQVQVQLKFIEISRSALREMGINVWYRGQGYQGGLIGPTGMQSLPENLWVKNTLPILGAPMSGSFSALFSTTHTPISATLSLLQSNGFAKTLSEPTLVAMSGQQADFLVGGEFPIPMPDSLGRVTVEFKNFGVQLKMTPTVLADQTIHLALTSIVSDLDASAGVTANGVHVPGLRSRQSSTVVRLKSGQSFALAGLMSDNLRTVVEKVPLLGDIPLIGTLFRTVHNKREETELVVLVSVNLVKPFAPGERPPLPGENELNDPSDIRLFLLGTVDPARKPKTATSAAGSNVPAKAQAVGPLGYWR